MKVPKKASLIKVKTPTGSQDKVDEIAKHFLASKEVTGDAKNAEEARRAELVEFVSGNKGTETPTGRIAFGRHYEIGLTEVKGTPKLDMDLLKRKLSKAILKKFVRVEEVPDTDSFIGLVERGVIPAKLAEAALQDTGIRSIRVFARRINDKKDLHD